MRQSLRSIRLQSVHIYVTTDTASATSTSCEASIARSESRMDDACLFTLLLLHALAQPIFAESGLLIWLLLTAVVLLHV